MLTREAFNALLKTLEEPPEHVKFIFCTTEPTKIPVTILSRCQRFDFAGILTQSIAQRLRQIVDAEGVEADPEALEVLARRAAGSMRDSQSLLEQLLAFSPGRITLDDVHGMLGTAGDGLLAGMVRHIVDRQPAAALADFDAALRAGVDAALLVEQLFGYFRDCMAAAAGCSAEAFLYVSPSRRKRYCRSRQKIGFANHPGTDADSRSGPFAHAIQHPGSDLGRVGPGADLPAGRPGRTAGPDCRTPQRYSGKRGQYATVNLCRGIGPTTGE